MSKKIFVANFPYRTSVQELTDLFSQHGEVSSAKIATDRESGRSRGFGFVEMTDHEQAAEAIKKLDGFSFEGRPLAVREAEDRQKPGGGHRRPGPGNRSRY